MQQPEVEQAYFVDNREFKATSAQMGGSGANWDPCGSMRIHGSCHGSWHGSCHESCWLRWVHFVLVAARPTLTASATAPRKTWTTRPEPDQVALPSGAAKWRCQVALPSGAAKSLSKVFSLSHCLICLPKWITFIIFSICHLSSSLVIFRHRNSPAFWGGAGAHGALGLRGPWCRCRRWMVQAELDVLRCCDAVMPWAEVMLEIVENCWKLLEIVGMIDVKWSRSAQEVLKSQRVNLSKVFKSQYWRCLKSKVRSGRICLEIIWESFFAVCFLFMALRGTRPTRLLAARVGAYYLPMSLTGLRVLTPKAPKTAIPNASKRYEMRRSYRRSEDWKSRLLRSLWCSGKISPAIRLPLLATFGANCRSHWRSCYYCPQDQGLSHQVHFNWAPGGRSVCIAVAKAGRLCQRWLGVLWRNQFMFLWFESIHVPMPSSKERHRTAWTTMISKLAQRFRRNYVFYVFWKARCATFTGVTTDTTVPRYICVDPQGVVTHLEPEEAESKPTGQVRRLEAGTRCSCTMWKLYQSISFIIFLLLSVVTYFFFVPWFECHVSCVLKHQLMREKHRKTTWTIFNEPFIVEIFRRSQCWLHRQAHEAWKRKPIANSATSAISKHTATQPSRDQFVPPLFSRCVYIYPILDLRLGIETG